MLLILRVIFNHSPLNYKPNYTPLIKRVKQLIQKKKLNIKPFDEVYGRGLVGGTFCIHIHNFGSILGTRYIRYTIENQCFYNH